MTPVRVVTAVLALYVLAATSGCGKDAAEADQPTTITISAPSMEPTFVKGDRVAVEHVPSELKTGMIVLFKDPGGWLSDGITNGKLVKRIVGVGGDRVKCCDDAGRIMLNGKSLDESSYLRPGTNSSQLEFSVQVPEGYLWLLGDNRDNSYDSRGHMGDAGGGFVDVRQVVGLLKPLRGPDGELIRSP